MYFYNNFIDQWTKGAVFDVSGAVAVSVKTCGCNKIQKIAGAIATRRPRENSPAKCRQLSSYRQAIARIAATPVEWS
jgi:hypothetical protein